jgi:hypothetical protein
MNLRNVGGSSDNIFVFLSIKPSKSTDWLSYPDLDSDKGIFRILRVSIKYCKNKFDGISSKAAG